MRNIRAATVQFEHSPGDKEYNLGRVTDFVVAAAAQQVELIAFPEMCTHRLLARSKAEPGGDRPAGGAVSGGSVDRTTAGAGGALRDDDWGWPDRAWG
jgi:predicted amidohydrolase